MRNQTTRTRLDLTRLDDRLVPSTTTTTTTARPFDFVADGTLTMINPGTDGTTPVTATSNTSVHLAGSLDYTSNTDGQTGLVSVSGSGVGFESATTPGQTGGRGGYTQTVQGQLSFSDADGVVATTTPLTGTVNWTGVSHAAGIDLIGPQALTGTLDTSDMSLNAGWSAGGTTGTLAVTLANATDTPTDLAFDTKTATLESDGSLTLDFSAVVTGNLLTAQTHTAEVAHVTAVWQGGGQTQTTDVDVPIYWNTGKVTAHVTGLVPPAWATGLKVSLDAAGQVAEADETNNDWTVTLADLGAPAVPPTVPPPPPADSGTPPPDAPPPSRFPRIPSDSQRVTASYTVVNTDVPVVQWRDAEGVVLASTPAFETYAGPIGIASADVNGDGVLDIAVAAGDGGGPRVRVLDGKTGAELLNFFAYEADFRGGVNIALADVTGDGKADLVTGAGVGGGPRVRVFNAVTGALENEFFAYDQEGRGGVRVAAADLDRDGTAEIVTTPGAGVAPPDLFVFNASGQQLFQAAVAADDYTGGISVTAAKDPQSTAVLVTATPDDGSPVARFRSQLQAGESILTRMPGDPIPVDPPLFTF